MFGRNVKALDLPLCLNAHMLWATASWFGRIGLSMMLWLLVIPLRQRSMISCHYTAMTGVSWKMYGGIMITSMAPSSQPLARTLSIHVMTRSSNHDICERVGEIKFLFYM
jgi:hypothetical protein